jgi:nucleoside 2-deoxyribosyltransferase
MRVYVAASSRECDRAERVMNELRAASHVISHDWIPGVRAAFAAGIEEAKADDAHAFEAALDDMNGVVTADVLVFLAPTDTSKMAWAELGAALARNIPVIVAHDDVEKRNQSIVTRLAHARVADADICAAVVGAFYMGRRV